MESVLPHSWEEEFSRAAAMRREDVLYREKMARFEDREREKREVLHREEEQHKRDDLAAFEAMLAPPEQIVEFRVHLDRSDAKTVEALMDNRQALEAIRQNLDTMLGEAHVISDGRRVFKTRDGQHVFDEHGAELSLSVIDPHAIDDARPRWETFDAAGKTEARLLEERGELIAYQAKLDISRKRLDKGQVTNKELKDMKDNLAETMPDAVRRKLGLDIAKPETAEQQVATQPMLPADMDGLMRQTGLSKPGPT